MTDPKNPSWLTLKPLPRPADGTPAIRLTGTPTDVRLSAWLPVEGDAADAHDQTARAVSLLALGEGNLATFLCRPLRDQALFADDLTREPGFVGFSIALQPRAAFTFPPLGQRYFIHASCRHLGAEPVLWTVVEA